MAEKKDFESVLMEKMMKDQFFEPLNSGQSCSVILSKCKKISPKVLRELNKRLETVEPGISYKLAVDEKTGIVAILIDKKQLSDAHFLAIFVQEHLVNQGLSGGPTMVASFPENGRPKEALTEMIDELMGTAANDSDIWVYSPVEIKMYDVLIVDNDETICHFLKNRLSLKGFQVQTAYDGQQGLQIFEEFEPQLVITDLMLPSMDGYQLIESIHQKDDWKGKILVLTGKRLEEDIRRCFEMGAADYMTKPFSPVELEARIRRLLIS